MNSPDIARTKAKPDNLILKPLKSNSVHQNDEMLNRDLSRTSYPIVQRGEKRFISCNEQDNASQEDRAKKRKIIRSEVIFNLSSQLASFSFIDFKCSPKSLRFSFSSAELTKAFKSILTQVDWSKVVLNVVEKDKQDCYRDAFAEIFRTRIKEILEQEESNVKISLKDCERDEKHNQEREETTNNNIEEEETNSDDEIEKEFEHLDDSFVETDEEDDDDSEGYEDVENENESVKYDTENYEDDDNQDGVSV